MNRASLVIAQVLASALLVACGGKAVLVDEDDAGSGGGGGNGGGSGAAAGSSGRSPVGTSTSAPTTPTVDASTPLPRMLDAGSDAGCGPIRVRDTGNCSVIWQHPCGVPAGVDVSDGLSSEECALVCGNGPSYVCSEYLGDVLSPTFECGPTCAEGRRPTGYVELPFDATVAGWLAHAADLERVSIDAFQILRRELESYGAPETLLRSAEFAEQDEVRHARILGGLARREGATLSAKPVQHGAVRSLLAIALENAVEGCVRETYGAVVAGWQAEHAERRDVRRAMERIHRDESAHAELAWEVHAWIMPQLSAAERASVDEALAAAAEELAASVALPLPNDLRSALGLPPPNHAVRLVAGLGVHLWPAVLAA